MDMTETERENFAEWLRGLQRRQFAGSAKAAYTAAGVNSATWERATTAQTVKPQTIVKIVNAFRPDAGGDWTKLGFDRPVSGAAQDDLDYVSGPGDKVEGGASDSEVLRAIAAMRQDVQAMEQRLSERLDRLEGPGA